jgi:hypothetical protein
MSAVTTQPEKKEFKRLLIHEDRAALENLLRLGNKACSKMGAVSSAYRALKLGPWGNEAYQSILGDGLEALYRKELARAEAAYQALPFKSATVQRDMLGTVTDGFAALREAVKALEQAATQSSLLLGNETSFPLELIAIEDGKAVIPEQVQEDVLERSCRIYMETPEDAEVYRRGKAMADAINEFLESVKALQPEAHYDTYHNLARTHFLLHQEDKTVKIDPKAIMWMVEKNKK